jgi:flagellar biosynthesis protein FlhF
MNVRRFTARSSRDALVLVRQALGDDAVVLSTQPCAEGVEVLAMSPASIEQIQRYSAAQGASAEPAKVSAPRFKAAASSSVAAPGSVASDVERLSMSTLSFQDYVRERMLRRRSAAMKSPAAAAEVAASVAAYVAPPQPPVQAPAPVQANVITPRRIEPVMPAPVSNSANTVSTVRAPANFREPPVLRDEIRYEQEAAVSAPARAPTQINAAVTSAFQNARQTSFQAHAVVPTLADVQPVMQQPVQASFFTPSQNHTQAHAQAHTATPQRDQQDMMIELRAMKGLIEDRFDTLAFVDKLQRQPAHARLAQRLLDCGFSPALIRKLTDGMGAEVTDEAAWVSDVLERNLRTAEGELPLEDQGGVFALIGSTGVGKTTSTAKLAAAFASKHGAMHLGLITLDAYRIGAHEQLRTYGRILGVPVHTAHDRASLEDLLELLSAKKMVLIDTAGMAQRDSRTRELLDMLSHRSIQKLLVINAAAQGETTEDVLLSYRASQAKGIVLSKLDEAVKLGPAIDALIRHKLPVTVVANGQRVPEDWHRLSGHALVQRALRPSAGTAYRIDASDVNLVFAATQGPIAVREASREATRAAGELLHTSRALYSQNSFAEHAHA